MITTPYDQIASQFDVARARLRPNEEKYLALLLEPLALGCSVLDLGCGTGHPIATYLASHGHRVVGVDASEAMLTLAKQRLPEQTWVHNLIEKVEFNETFDAVVCWDSLFHVPREHWAPVIRRIHRWLRPQSRFMMSSGGIVDPDGHGFIDTMFDHEFYYDGLPPDSLLALLNEVGFDLLLAEMCDHPDGGRNRDKWATVASRKA